MTEEHMAHKLDYYWALSGGAATVAWGLTLWFYGVEESPVFGWHPAVFVTLGVLLSLPALRAHVGRPAGKDD